MCDTGEIITMSGGKFETIPLTIILRETGSTVKETFMLLRISHALESRFVHVIAACEEGVFDAQLSRPKIKRGKTKADLSEENWLSITNTLFNDDFLSETALPKEFENVYFVGKLTSLEQYDEVTGDLIGDELADEVPEFELSICSKGILLVIYGSFKLSLRSTEGLMGMERQKYDILQWVQWQTEQIKELKTKLLDSDRRAGDQEQIATIKEDEIKEMTNDYKSIILDLEDRFFQVLESKKRKIRELEGDDSSDLELLNLEYKKRNAQNLNIVNIEDIVLGDAHTEIRKPQRKRIKKEVEEEMEEIKEEESDRPMGSEIGESEGEGENNDNDDNDEEEDASDEYGDGNEEGDDNGEGDDIGDANDHEKINRIDIDDEEQQKVKMEPDSNVNAQSPSDATMYSGSENQSPEADSTDYGSDGEETKDQAHRDNSAQESHQGDDESIEDLDEDPDEDPDDPNEDTDYGSD